MVMIHYILYIYHPDRIQLTKKSFPHLPLILIFQLFPQINHIKLFLLNIPLKSNRNRIANFLLRQKLTFKTIRNIFKYIIHHNRSPHIPISCYLLDILKRMFIHSLVKSAVEYHEGDDSCVVLQE